MSTMNQDTVHQILKASEEIHSMEDSGEISDIIIPENDPGVLNLMQNVCKKNHKSLVPIGTDGMYKVINEE